MGYDKELLARLLDRKLWWEDNIANKESLNRLYLQIAKDIKDNSISGKIALIMLQHQLFHELLKELISISIFYLQCEIWPTKYEPIYDKREEKTTGWYIDYFENYCIDCSGKLELIKTIKNINRIRNKVAHNLIGKNELIINRSYSEFINYSNLFLDELNQCARDINMKLEDLGKRMDLESLISSINE